MRPETLAYELIAAAEPQIAPAGDRIIFTRVTVDTDDHRRRRELWWCAVDGTDLEPLGQSVFDESGARWSPDGRCIAYVATDTGTSRLLVRQRAAGDEPFEVARHAQSLGDICWSPDGRTLAYTTLYDPDNPAEVPESAGVAPRVRVTRRLDYKEDGRGYLGNRRSHVFVVDAVPGGESRRLTSHPVDHDAPQWSPRGRRIGMRVHLPDRAGDSLLVHDLETNGIEELGPGRGGIVHWAWSPDGERILYAGDPNYSLQPDYFICHVADGSIECLIDDLRSSPDPSPAVWLDETTVLVHAFEAGASVLQTIDLDTGNVESIDRPLSRNAGLSVDRAGRFVAQVESSLTSTGNLRVFDRQRGTAEIIVQSNSEVFEAQPPAAWESFAVQRGEFAIDAWLLKPPDFDPSRRYPVILDVHGGPNANYGYGFLAHEQCFATNGFLVVYANPRGSTSYGRHFAKQVIGDWGGGDYDDLMAVLDSVLERPYADAERTGIFGISYGGYMTAWAISQSNRFRAAVCGSPIFDLESDWGTSDVAFNGLEHHGGGPPHEKREWYDSHSPSTFAHRTRTPTLIFHGEADHRCPIGQSEQMFVALKKAGCEVEFVRYPGGSHMFFEWGLPEHRADFLTRTLAWFQQHL